MKVDRYGSVLPDKGFWSDSAEMFRIQLADCLSEWQAAGHNRVWLTLSQSQSNLIDAATNAGFDFHRVEDGDLVLLKQLNPDAIVPPLPASHHVGAGAFVLNEANELLVIAERTADGASGYKIPGGFIEQGEHIASGIVREVREETGVETRFESLVMFRHLHRTTYGKSNVYFVCRLGVISAEITIDPIEIAECLWMPVDAFLSNERSQYFHKGIVRAALTGSSMHVGRLPDYHHPPERAEFFFPTNYTPQSA